MGLETTETEATPVQFLPVYRDEDGWFRFNILMADGALFKSGEYAHEVNAERDREYCQRENSVDNLETTFLYSVNAALLKAKH